MVSKFSLEKFDSGSSCPANFVATGFLVPFEYWYGLRSPLEYNG